jgi:hypothetical protein
MAKLRAIAAAAIGLAMIGGAGTALYKVYRQPPSVPLQEEASVQPTLVIPTIDQMCKTLGAAEGDALKQCQADENAAGEFVTAWMNLNNFMIDGQISLEQIQILASLDDSSALPQLNPADPTSGFAPSDPSLGADPPSQITAGIDPVTGQAQGFLQSPAQLALYCLNMSGDWVSLHDCISENDPSSHIDGAQ